MKNNSCYDRHDMKTQKACGAALYELEKLHFKLICGVEREYKQIKAAKQKQKEEQVPPKKERVKRQKTYDTEYFKEYYEKNKERKKEYAREYYEKTKARGTERR